MTITPYIAPGSDGTGLDDGVYLPGRAPRKKPAPKSPEELAGIRAKAWVTRRAKV
jgi:hypothetical protein